MNFAEYNVKDANLEEILLALKSLDTVEAVALGGSRSTGASEENSDYDIYVYCAEIPTAETRENLLENTVRLQNSAIIIGRARTTRL